MAAIRSPESRFLEDVFNHVALPPRLPGRQDVNIPSIERALIDRLLIATSKVFSGVTDGGAESLRRSLEIAKRVNLNGRLTKTSLLAAFRVVCRRELNAHSHLRSFLCRLTVIWCTLLYVTPPVKAK